MTSCEPNAMCNYSLTRYIVLCTTITNDKDTIFVKMNALSWNINDAELLLNMNGS
jgi:hypothetical protein